MASEVASRDKNRVPTMLGVDPNSIKSTVKIAVDPTTHAVIVELV